MRFIIAVLIVLIMATTASAITIEEYSKLMKDSNTKEYIQMYINGLGQGYQLANPAGQERIYCISGKLRLNIDNLTDIINEQIKKYKINFENPMEDKLFTEAPIGIMLLRGLKETFPCK